MKKLLVALLAVELIGCGVKESEYQGKPVSAWVQALDQGSAPARAQASNVLTQAGKVDPTVINGLVAALKKGSIGAADVLGRIGPAAAGGQGKEAVLALGHEVTVKGNARNSLRLACARAIGKFGMAGKEGVPGLLEMLKDDDPLLREQAAETLGQLPPDAVRAAIGPLLVVARTDQAINVQQTAIAAVKAIDPSAIDPKP